jgi:nucleotide-binding universal stress UspA family protein
MTVEISRVLFPTDFSAPSALALNYARGYCERFGATLGVVHVLHLTNFFLGDGTFAFGEEANRLRQAARQELDALAARLRAEGQQCTTQLLEGPPHVEIGRYATEWKADLLVIGTHGRTGLDHVTFGSVTERVLHAAPCPVLVIPAAKK